jgi:dTDP-4-amino-4,6-dideoxygalactose transaminase
LAINAKEEFLPFSRPSISEAAIEEVVACIRSGWITTGPRVKQFEDDLKAYLGAPQVLCLTSATAGLHLVLTALKLKPGDEVITTPMTFAATLNTIVLAGGTPVCVDVEPGTCNMDAAKVEGAVTSRTRAIMPVHFAGLPVDMDPLYDIAKKRGLRVIEDAAHAIGTAYKGRRIGSFGDVQVFSFHPNKNMTTIEGGALVVNDFYEAKTVEILRFHGIVRLPDGTRDVAFPGGKFNLPDVNACVGLAQLAQLDAFNARRRALAARYFARLRTDPACLLPHPGYSGDEAGHSWNMFAPLLPLDAMSLSRQEFRARLDARGIGTGVSYEAAHLASAFADLGYRFGDLPHTERIAEETLTLPLFPTMTDADVDRVCDACADVVNSCRR